MTDYESTIKGILSSRLETESNRGRMILSKVGNGEVLLPLTRSLLFAPRATRSYMRN